VGELLWPLLNGAAIVLARPGGHQDAAYLGEMLREEGITVLGALPQMLESMVQDGSVGDSPALRLVYCVGQNLQGGLVSHFAKESKAQLINTYAQTEACPVSFHLCHADIDKALVPVGEPAPNTGVYILDAYLQLAPVGMSGEIAVTGPGLAQGYAGNPRLTAEKFVPSPYGSPGERMYRTGDIGRRHDNGELVLLGRNDDRVKIRGYRIDLREIEQVLREIPMVDQAAVLAEPAGDGVPAIAAFFTLRPAGAVKAADLDPWHKKLLKGRFPQREAGPNAPVEEQVRAILQARLPHYMMPARLQSVSAIPVGRTGKVDRQALLALSIDSSGVHGGDRAGRDDAPRNDLEEKLVAIWRTVLDVPAGRRVGIYDSFFELGGHSLTAVAIVKKIQRELGVKLELRNVFEAVTIAGLSDLIDWTTRAQALEDIEL
jgi:acyl-coenzyme A synthetase/AMP-(fatty) acid ligase/acyl carrier protein